MRSSTLILILLICTSLKAEANHFTLSDSIVSENDSLLTTSIFFKTQKKTGRVFIHRKSIPFLDNLAAFMLRIKPVEIEIIRFHSPMVRSDYEFIGGNCKPYIQLDIIANYIADWGVYTLRIRIRECHDLPIAKDFDMEKLTIIRITKAEEDESPFKKRGKP